MPPLILPEDLLQQLHQSKTGTINNMDRTGVAVYWNTDGSARANIYVGLILDGYKLYQNISLMKPNINIQFSIPPVLPCQSDLKFDPNKDGVIRVKVSRRS